jgi:cystathionine gamma-synthase/methionine-gamma-lyase
LNHFESKAIHAGEQRRFSPAAEGSAQPVSTPISPSVSYTYPRSEDLDAALAGDPSRFVYHRYGNPTVTAFEQAMIALECHDMPERAGEYAAFATSSGMSAIHLAMLAGGACAGNAVAVAQDCYGATYAMAANLLPSMGVTPHFVDTTDLAAVAALLAQVRPRFLLVEAISNPLLKVMDLPALARLCQESGTLLMVDNTFATPLLYRPLVDGADFVIHSATKFIGGHGDVMGGVVIARESFREQIWSLLKTTGGTIGPHEAWLLLRGLKTLALRMERQCDQALAVAEWLSQHPRIRRVYYPGLAAHPQHELATSQFGGRYGAVVAFEIDGAGQAEVFRFLDRLQLVQSATSLGDVYSLVLYPAQSSHRALTPEQRQAVGISDGLLRLSVGIEALPDIQADLAQALD